MEAKEFIKKWLVGYEDLEHKAELSIEMETDLIEYANQSKWISVETLPEKKQVRYQCLAEVHPRRESFYENNYAIVQDWVIRQHPENFIKYKPLIELK